MCGRYNVTPNAAAFIDAFDIIDGLELLSDRPMYNIAPSTDRRETRVPAVRSTEHGRELAMLRWPLVPHWAKAKMLAYNTANAKSETLAEKPAYRDAWRKRRCLIPANGYYEWQAIAGQHWKQPYHIAAPDGGLFAFGGLWDRSSNDGTTIESCTIVTVPANARLRPIHHRMPLIVPAAGYADWLSGSTEQAANWLQPSPDDLLVAVPISTYVNNPNHDDPRCLEPLAVVTEGPGAS